MSHFTKIETQIRDEECLLKALADLGYSEVERGTDLPLYGYQDDRRPETADVVIRRQHLSVGSNDVGFKRQADGTYQAIVSEFDHERGFLWNQRKNQLLQSYARHRVLKSMAKQGLRLVGEERQADGTLRLVTARR